MFAAISHVFTQAGERKKARNKSIDPGIGAKALIEAGY
jgi:hypothetical protein